jgi:aldehyde:ferredoxin oxidoreductase
MLMKHGTCVLTGGLVASGATPGKKLAAQRIAPSDVKLPDRMAGQPPQEEGPVAGVTLDVDNLAREYRQAMGWDPDSGRPDVATLDKLGLKDLVAAFG